MEYKGCSIGDWMINYLNGSGTTKFNNYFALPSIIIK